MDGDADELFHGPWPAIPEDGARRIWEDLDRMRQMSLDDFGLALEELTRRSDVPPWLLLVVFHMAWAHLVIERPPREIDGMKLSAARGKVVCWHAVEDSAIRHGFLGLTSAAKQVIPYLDAVDGDDISWTMHLLPGEDDQRT